MILPLTDTEQPAWTKAETDKLTDEIFCIHLHPNPAKWHITRHPAEFRGDSSVRIYTGSYDKVLQQIRGNPNSVGYVYGYGGPLNELDRHLQFWCKRDDLKHSVLEAHKQYSDRLSAEVGQAEFNVRKLKSYLSQVQSTSVELDIEISA